MRILGLILLVAGGATFAWTAPRLDQVRQPLNTLREHLDPAYADQVATWQTLYYGAIAAMVVGAVVFLGGLVSKARRR